MEFKTEDLQLAIHLSLCGSKLKNIERTENRKRQTFVFSDEEGKSEELIKSFWSKSVSFPVLDVMREMAEMKRRLYQG